MRTRPIINLCCMAVCAIATTSCFNKDFDLSNIDMTLGSRVDLTIPGIDSTTIRMKSILNLKEDGIIQKLADGTYVLKQDSSAKIDPIKIGNQTIGKKDINPISATLSLSTAARKKDLTIPDYTYVLSESDGTTNLSTTESSEITDVISIKSVKFQKNTATLNATISGLPTSVSTIYLDDLKLKMPKDLNITNCTVNGVEKGVTWDDKGNLILNNGKDTQGINWKTGLKIVVTFDGATIGENFTFKDQKAQLSGKVGLMCTIRIPGSGITSMPQTISFAINTKIADDITITHFSGDIKHVVGAVNPIELKNIPDFLNDPKTIINLANPAIFVKAKITNLTSDLKTSLSFSSDKTATVCSSGDLIIKNGTENIYCLAKDPEQAIYPSGYEQAQRVKVDYLDSLVYRVPKKININITPVTGTVTDFELAKEYPIAVNYSVFTPLSFSDDLNLIYKDTERDWGLPDEWKNVTTDMTTITVTGLLDNLVCSAINFSVTPLDCNAQEITDLDVFMYDPETGETGDSIRVESMEKNKPVTICIMAKLGKTLQELLTGNNRLDGMTYKAVMDKPGDDNTLNANSSVYIHGIHVNVKGNVIYNAN